MSETSQAFPDQLSNDANAIARLRLDDSLAKIASFDPSANSGFPVGYDDVLDDSMASGEPLEQQTVHDYATVLKSTIDESAIRRGVEPNYSAALDKMINLTPQDLKTLHESNGGNNPLSTMLHQQVAADLSEGMGGSTRLRSAFNVAKKIYGTESIPEIAHLNPDDDMVKTLASSLQAGVHKINDVYVADTNYSLKAGSRMRRIWMAEAVGMATGITDPERSDAYTYALSRATMGEYSLELLVERIKTYGPQKLEAIRKFANISALASYSDEQLDRMYKLSQGNPSEIERLKGHDVIVVLINMEGDHNGVSMDVAERLDDDAERTLFFEINNPDQVYGHLKKLHDMGIKPTSLVFASHGSSGQYFISERPSFDSDETIDHVTVIHEQAVVDHIVAKSGDPNPRGYSIENANGLIRSVQRFMQPSRAIDDPDKDLGRKKIISLSCQFDGEANLATMSDEGEVVRTGKNTLLKRLGEVMVGKLVGEHIDIYGAEISTKAQTKTKRGFHYNQLINGRRAPYLASVMHIDGPDTEWHKLNEVQLRKSC